MTTHYCSFNEAAGFTQRKHRVHGRMGVADSASMRPPVLPSGNPAKYASTNSGEPELQ